MKLSDYVFQFVAGLGVKTVFMLPGGGCMHLVDSLGRCKDLDWIVNLHEQACSIGADAYAQYTENIGVALVTTGPGGTNAITGVAASYLDSTPVLILSGQVKTSDLAEQYGVRQLGFQELPITRIVEPITKYCVVVKDPKSIRYHLEKAVFLARTGRPGPVWIDIPLDVQAADIDVVSLPAFIPDSPQTSMATTDVAEKVREMYSILRESRRPLALIGNGVRLSGARRECFEFLEKLQIPVQTTWKTMDYLAEDHELFAGRPGIIGQRGANFAIQTCDCLITIGARLDYGQIGYDHKAFARTAKKIIVDIDEREIAKLGFDVHVKVVSDVKVFLDEAIRNRENFPLDKWALWRKRCADWKKRYPLVLQEYFEEKDFVNQYVFIDSLSKALKYGDLLIPGSSGACCEATMQALKVIDGVRVFYTPGLGSMGFGIPAAVGGCVAAGKKRTVCVEGDGSFQMNSQELEVVRREGLPIKFFIFENKGYASIRLTQNNHFKGHLVACDTSSGLTLPDIGKLAGAYGIPFIRIMNHEGIDAKIENVMNMAGPVICELNISSRQVTMPRLSSGVDEHGRIVSKPLEDLWPFLNHAEFEANMKLNL